MRHSSAIGQFVSLCTRCFMPVQSEGRREVSFRKIVGKQVSFLHILFVLLNLCSLNLLLSSFGTLLLKPGRERRFSVPFFHLLCVCQEQTS